MGLLLLVAGFRARASFISQVFVDGLLRGQPVAADLLAPEPAVAYQKSEMGRREAAGLSRFGERNEVDICG